MTGDMDLDTLRDTITTTLNNQPVTVTGWILAFETSSLDADGDVNGTWGAVLSASTPTAIGLCELVADDLRHAQYEED